MKLRSFLATAALAATLGVGGVALAYTNNGVPYAKCTLTVENWEYCSNRGPGLGHDQTYNSGNLATDMATCKRDLFIWLQNNTNDQNGRAQCQCPTGPNGTDIFFSRGLTAAEPPPGPCPGQVNP
jgi:hypothetical protein